MNDLTKKDSDEKDLKVESAILEIVKRGDVDPARLEKFLDLQVKMEERQAERELSEALAMFQSECPTIRKTKKGHNSNYAPIDEIVHIIRPILKKHGLSYSFNTNKINDNEKEMTVTVRHTGGGKFESSYVFPALDDGGRMNSSQRGKSANSYAKRTLIENALGLVTADEDDDARRAVDDPASDEQLSNIKKLMEATQTTEERFLKYMKVEKLKEMSVYDAKRAITALKQKRSKGVQANKL